MIIFRVEHATDICEESDHNIGPFQYVPGESYRGTDIYTNNASDPDACPQQHPTPCDEKIERDEWDESFVCAVYSLEQVVDWFSDDAGRRALRDHGFVIREYKANVYKHLRGEMQCMVRAKNLKQVNEFDLATLMPVFVD